MKLKSVPSRLVTQLEETLSDQSRWRAVGWAFVGAMLGIVISWIISDNAVITLSAIVVIGTFGAVATLSFLAVRQYAERARRIKVEMMKSGAESESDQLPLTKNPGSNDVSSVPVAAKAIRFHISPLRHTAPYSIAATVKTPALVIYLLDVSGSMGRHLTADNDSSSFLELTTELLRSMAIKMVQRSTKGAVVASRYRIAMYAYSSMVSDILGGIKTIEQVAQLGVPQFTPQDVSDAAQAFAAAENLLIQELPDLQDCPAPLICHIADGQYNGADPSSVIERIMNLRTRDGNVLIANILHGMSSLDLNNTKAIAWRGFQSRDELRTAYEQQMFDLSSTIPDTYQAVVREYGFSIVPGSRMLIPAHFMEIAGLIIPMSSATPTVA